MKPRKKFSESHHSSLNELNITPLLDLAFVLLVIFIITTPQMMNNLEMNLPSGKTPPPNAAKPKINDLVISETGELYLNKQAMTFNELQQALTYLRSNDKDVSVAVRGADNVDYQHVVNVLDLLRRLDITKVGLATATVSVSR